MRGVPVKYRGDGDRCRGLVGYGGRRQGRALLASGHLASGEATVMELAAPFKLTQPAISHHLKVLDGAGLVIRRIEGTKRPCQLSPAGIGAIDRWLAMLRDILAKNYNRLDGVLADMETAP